MRLTHVDSDGKARMVDVSEKRETSREARAFGTVRMSEEAYGVVRQGQGPKGDVFTVGENRGHNGGEEDVPTSSPSVTLCPSVLSTWHMPSGR